MQPFRIVFVRHAESTNNQLFVDLDLDRAEFDRRRHSDAPLTERGVEQVTLAGKRVAELYPEARLVKTSYFHRALRTAQAVATALKDAAKDAAGDESTLFSGPGADVVVVRDLHEVGGHYHLDAASGKHVGTPGRTAAAVQEEFPGFRCRAEDACDAGWWHGPTKESRSQANERALRVLALFRSMAAAAAAGKGHAIAVVITHGDFYRTFMDEALKIGALVGRAEPVTLLDNAGITELAFVSAPPVADAPESPKVAGDAQWVFTIERENDSGHVDSVGKLQPLSLIHRVDQPTCQ